MKNLQKFYFTSYEALDNSNYKIKLSLKSGPVQESPSSGNKGVMEGKLIASSTIA